MKFDIAGLFKKKSSDDDDYDEYEDDDEEDQDDEGSGGGDSGGDDDDDNEYDFDDDEEDGGSDKKKKLAIIGGGVAAALVVVGGIGWFLSGGEEEEVAEPTSGNQVSLALPAIGQKTSAGGTGSTMTPPKSSGPSLNDLGASGGKAASGGRSLNSLNDIASKPPPQAAAGVATVTPGMAPGAAAPMTAAVAVNGKSAVKTGRMPAPSGGAGVVVPSVFEGSYTKVAKATPGKPLGPAPVRELVEETKDGYLPIINAAGLSSQKAYARPFSDNAGMAKISIIVSGLGLSSAATQAAITHLPPEVTLAFDAYGRQLEKWIPAARAAGHEVLLSLPMEPINYPISDPGPLALLTTLRADTNMGRLNKILGKGGGYVGLVTTMGSQFSTSENSLRPILLKLKERGVLLVDRHMTPSTKIAKVGGEVGLTTALVDVPVDRMATPRSIDLALGELEVIAQTKKTAMGIASPYPVSIDRIVTWAEKLKDRNVALVPVSAVATVPAVQKTQ